MPEGLIALLEDEPLLRGVVAEALTSEGYQVLPAETHARLLSLVAEGRVRAVVADFWGRSYSELSAEDRAEIQALGRTAPTVLVSGRAWLRQVQAEDLGVVALLTKPYDLDDLLDAVAWAVAASAGE